MAPASSCKVLQFTQHGWPEKPEPVFQPYHNKRLELTQEDGILLWNSRVIVPEVLRTLLLKDLHAEHLGIVQWDAMDHVALHNKTVTTC